MTQAVLSLGSNLGDRLAYLRDAVAGLGDAALVVSGVYETPPWPPGHDVPAYLNAAVLAAESPSPPGPAAAYQWLARARALEQAAGRERVPDQRFAPRTLDVDVIMVWDSSGTPVTCDDPELTVPHPRAYLRAFVLRPWVEIQPYARLPGHGRLTDLLRTPPVADELAGLRPRPDLTLDPLP